MTVKKEINKLAKILFSISLIMLTISEVMAQKDTKSIEVLEKQLDSLFLAKMSMEHIPGAAFILIKDGKVVLKKGYGFSRLGSRIRKVDPDSTIFRIGSITKTFTATALLQLADKNVIDLHRDVNYYLKTVKVPNTHSSPITASHLLSHSAGLDEIAKGRVVYSKDELIPLASFLKNRLIRVRPPGIVPAYSTYGIALSGLLVEDLSNMPLESYFKKNIWEPLSMSMTNIVVPKNLEPFIALGYEYEDGVNVPQPWEWYHTFPASSINSTATDMGKYMQMHLNFGAYNNKTILSKKVASEMQKQQLSVHAKVSGFGYGFYENEWHGIKTMDHGGDMLGFSSYMALAPKENLGVFVVHHHESTNLRREAVSIIMRYYGSLREATAPQPIPSNLKEFAGTYRWLSNCITCSNNETEQTWKLTVNDDNTLSGFGRRFIQIEPLLFKSVDGERTMGFRKNAKGEIHYMSLGNVNVFEKIKSD